MLCFSDSTRKMDSNENEEELSWSCWLRTILVGSGAIILLIFIGMNEAQSSVMLPQLKQADSFIQITPDEETWIASLGLVMVPVASIISGPILDAFGRKKGLQFFYLNTGLGYAIMACAREVYQIYVGRIICGLGSGLLACAVIYMVEICTKKQREYFFSLTSALFASGMVIMSTVSGYLPWNIASLIFSAAAFILFIIQCFVPESPAWLFKSGKEDAAVRNLQILGRSEPNIRLELDALKLQCKGDKENIEWRTFLEPTVWKPFVIMVVFFLLQNASGISLLFYYAVDFVERLGTTYNPLDVAVMLSTTRFVAGCTICIFFRTKVGRKHAVAFSAFWMMVAFVCLGAYEYVYNDVRVSDRLYPWFPVVSLIIYLMASVLGLLGLPWVMSGEVYPLRVRGTMTGVTYVIGYGFMFIVIKTYNACIEAFQIYELLFLYAGVSGVAVLFAIFVLPETQNKSLLEIEQSFLPKNRQLEVDASPATAK